MSRKDPSVNGDLNRKDTEGEDALGVHLKFLRSYKNVQPGEVGRYFNAEAEDILAMDPPVAEVYTPPPEED